MDEIGGMMDGMFGSGLGMIIMVIVMLAVLGLAIAGAVWVVREVGGRSRRAIEPPATGAPAVDGPREILQRRYAAGEIDEDEYFRRLSGLEQP